MTFEYDLGPKALPESSSVAAPLVVAFPDSAPRTTMSVLVINFVKAASDRKVRHNPFSLREPYRSQRA
jgi:hypothetical protein